MDESLTDRTATAFRARTLPKAEWTHHAHLRVGLWHVLHFPPDDALAQLRDGIRAFNDICGVANTDSGGYHETITRFYVQQVAAFLAAANRSRPLDELADELIARVGGREYPFRFYTKERLNSLAARRGWLEPDLRPPA